MIEIIPAADIIGGKCVRLTQGDYNIQKTYDLDPLKMAQKYVDAGLKNLHLVDLEGAKVGMLKNTFVLDQIAQNTSLRIDCGGGIKNIGDIEMLFSLGAYAVNLGSVAVNKPEIMVNVLKKYGGDKIILSADVDKDLNVKIRGWQDDSGLKLNQLIDNFLPYGLKKICVTAIKCDGMLSGPDFLLYSQLKKDYPDLYLIASGGVSNIQDIEKLDLIGCDAVIVGKAIYENRITLEELANLNK